MKKAAQALCVLLPAALFIFFKVHTQQNPPVTFVPFKPSVPSPVVHMNPSVLIDRICIGESTLGLPFCLEVRQFELKGVTAAELIAWHLNLLDGPCEEVYISELRKVYILRGQRSAQRSDTTHGFALFQGERALFLDCYEKEGLLYMCTGEAPLETFQEHEAFLRGLSSQGTISSAN